MKKLNQKGITTAPVFVLAVAISVIGFVGWQVYNARDAKVAKLQPNNEQAEDRPEQTLQPQEFIEISELDAEVSVEVLKGATAYYLDSSDADENEHYSIHFYVPELENAKRDLSDEQSELIDDCLKRAPVTAIVASKYGEVFPNDKYTADLELNRVNGYSLYLVEPQYDCTEGDELVQEYVDEYISVYDRVEVAKAIRSKE